MSELKSCPCGKIPTAVVIVTVGRFEFVTGNCCRTYHIPCDQSDDSSIDEYWVVACKTWNDAPRATPAGTIITEDESTWPGYGTKYAFREWDGFEFGELEVDYWYAKTMDEVEMGWIGCIWWPIPEGMFQPLTTEVSDG